MSEEKGQNRRLVLAEVPKGMPKNSDWNIEHVAIPECKDGQILVKCEFVSVDPYLRGRLRTQQKGDVVVSGTVAKVVESKNKDYAVGDHVMQYLPWQEYNAFAPDASTRKVDPKVAPVSTALGVLGMPGMTAYFGMLDVCELKEGETVVISGAAGAVGTIAGQIAKIKGCRVVGTAGSKDKCDYLLSLGFDVAINYKEFDDAAKMQKELHHACPKGIDVYFDNTGGHVTDAVFPLINNFARIGICGQISIYNSMDEVPQGPRFLHHLIYKNATIKGFVVSRFMNRGKEFFEHMGKWVQEGKVKYNETVVKGFEHVPDAFIGLFTGTNTGKLIVQA